MDGDSDDAGLGGREEARVRRRDRRLQTRMVVDNASVKRIAHALAEKRRHRDEKEESPPGDA